MRGAALALAAGALCLAGVAVAAEPSDAPSPPRVVRASAGTTGTVGVVEWQAPGTGGSALGYRVWRAESDGVIIPIGAVPAEVGRFDDITGLPGEVYRYGVSAMGPAGHESEVTMAGEAVTAAWSLSPHTKPDPLNVGISRTCAVCHQLHAANPGAPLLREGPASTGASAVCSQCHAGNALAPDVSGGPDSFSLFSGHALDATPSGGDLTTACGSCHDVHASSASDPKLRPSILRTPGGTATVTGAVSWCLACHDARAIWYSEKYGTAYPSPGTGERDADGYPLTGTWPGPEVYTDPARNAHARIPASPARAQGDCLYCHAAHRGANLYDGLRLTFRPTTAGTLAEDQSSGSYAALCFSCHDGSRGSAVDIARYALSSSANAGHRTMSVGRLPQRAPLPCYDCHDPHGTGGSAYGLLVVASTGPGTSVVLGDAPGELVMGAGASAADVRRFCFGCHTTSDTSAGWDGAEMSPVSAGALFEGIDRTSTAARLRLPVVDGHRAADARSCYDCHGSDYTDKGSANVHAPAVPVGSLAIPALGLSDPALPATPATPVP